MVRLPSAYDELESYTRDLCEFIESPFVRQITGGIHVNDAFIYNAWDALPAEWASWWDSLPDHRLAQQDLIDSIQESDWNHPSSEAKALCDASRPHSLTAWLGKLQSLALPRTQRPDLPPSAVLPDELAARMKTKKVQEIATAVAYVYEQCRRHNITRVVEMGSGQGYLSISLAYLHPELSVLAIDGSESQIAGSKAFASSLGIPAECLRQEVRWIDGSLSLTGLVQDWAGGEACMLVGLHACGSLSEHMLRYFATSSCIEAIAVVGCCYNHIAPRSASNPQGFPISAHLRAFNATLSATALMVGCQSPNNWQTVSSSSSRNSTSASSSVGSHPASGLGNIGSGRRVDPPSPFSRRRLYRAILEKLLYDRGLAQAKAVDVDERPTNDLLASASGKPGINNNNASAPEKATTPTPRPNWGIRKEDLASFTTFARRALQSVTMSADGKAQDVRQISDAELATYEARYAGSEGRIAVLWTLSVVCCKVVESVVAVDRLWFLLEEQQQKQTQNRQQLKGIDVVPIFDAAVSPRNLMMVASKSTMP